MRQRHPRSAIGALGGHLVHCSGDELAGALAAFAPHRHLLWLKLLWPRIIVLPLADQAQCSPIRDAIVEKLGFRL